MKAERRLFPGAGPYGRSTPVLPCPSMPSKSNGVQEGQRVHQKSQPKKRRVKNNRRSMACPRACLGVRPVPLGVGVTFVA
jgi:hypothetical protein